MCSVLKETLVIKSVNDYKKFLITNAITILGGGHLSGAESDGMQDLSAVVFIVLTEDCRDDKVVCVGFDDYGKQQVEMP